MPRLTGHFPLTVTMVLRALTLQHGVSLVSGGSSMAGRGRATAGQNKEQLALQVRDTLLTLFERPFYASGQPKLLQQVCARGKSEVGVPLLTMLMQHLNVGKATTASHPINNLHPPAGWAPLPLFCGVPAAHRHSESGRTAHW